MDKKRILYFRNICKILCDLSRLITLYFCREQKHRCYRMQSSPCHPNHHEFMTNPTNKSTSHYNPTPLSSRPTEWPPIYSTCVHHFSTSHKSKSFIEHVIVVVIVTGIIITIIFFLKFANTILNNPDLIHFIHEHEIN